MINLRTFSSKSDRKLPGKYYVTAISIKTGIREIVELIRNPNFPIEDYVLTDPEYIQGTEEVTKVIRGFQAKVPRVESLEPYYINFLEYEISKLNPGERGALIGVKKFMKEYPKLEYNCTLAQYELLMKAYKRLKQ